MKKLLLIASGVLLCFTSCWKEKVPPKAGVALVGTTWKIESHVTGNVEPGADCRVAQEIVFFKDSTGYYYYPTKCDSSDHDTVRFRWYPSADSKNIYMSKVDGNPGIIRSMGISYYDMNALRLRGESYFKRYLDGYFVASPKR